MLAGVERDYVWTRLQNQAIAGLRQSMFERLQQTSMGFHRRAPFNTVLEGFSSGLTAVETAMSMAVPWDLALVEAVVALLLMCLLDWRIGFISVVLVPWIFLAPSGMSRRADRATAVSQEQQRGVLSLVQESLLAQPLIRAFSLEQMGASAFRHRNDVLARAALRAGVFSAFAERFTSAGGCFCRFLHCV